MRANFPTWLLFLSALTALGPLSIDMYLPAFIAIADGLDSARGEVERTLPMFLAGLSIGQLVYGPISDRFGRRPPLIAGLSIYVLGSTGCALAQDIEALSAWRLVQALGGGVGMVVARAVIRDRLDAQNSARALSRIMLVMGVAPILAPLAGGWMLEVASWRGIFVVQAAFGTFCLLWGLAGLRESRPLDSVRPLNLSGALRTYARLLRDPQLLLPGLAGGFGMAGMFAYIAGSPFVLIGLYGVDEQHYGLLFGLNAFGLIGASQLNGYWLRRHGPQIILRRTAFVPAIAGVALVGMTLPGQPPLPLLMAGLFVYASSLGAITPNTSAIAMAAQGRNAGAAAALLGSLTFLAGMAAGLAVSLFKGHSALPMAGVMAVCGLLSASMGWATLRGSREPDAPVLEVGPFV